MLNSPALKVSSVSVYRRSLTGHDCRVLEDASFCIAAGERVALLGPNGAGKTSLLHAIVGAARFDGSIEVVGRRVERKNLERIRRDVGFLFSEPRDQLFTGSVHDEVGFGLSRRDVEPAEVDRRVSDALARVGLAGFERRNPAELSLGEQRRVCLACALAEAPALLLLDEPTASLDPVARADLLSALAQSESAQLFATHDLQAAKSLAESTVLLSGGRVVDSGPIALLDDPARLLAAGLIRPASPSR